ncbi:MAG TPA: ABC transporter permease [Planctomycetota bacterium]|nr:ABC transporter permease [Planctomycetota bacterium]
MAKKILSAVALVALWMLLWQLIFIATGSKAWKFAPPLDVVKDLWDGLVPHKVIGELWQEYIQGERPETYSGKVLRGIIASLIRVLYGYGIALVLGVIVGLLLVSSRFFEWLLGPLILGIQSLPSICWLPLAILWFGLGENAILFVVLMGSLGSITIATRDGLRQVPVTYQRVAATFGAAPMQRMLWVNVPAALPVFISGLKQGWSFAWRSLLAGELLYRSISAGSLLMDARELNDYPRMFAVMIMIVLVSILIDRILFAKLEARIHARWGLAK